MVLRMTRRRQWKRLCLGRTSLYRFQHRFLCFPRVVHTSSACLDDSSGNGKSLFVCKKPCFALEQGMSKVSAVENIIRELHGPVDTMLSRFVERQNLKRALLLVLFMLMLMPVCRLSQCQRNHQDRQMRCGRLLESAGSNVGSDIKTSFPSTNASTAFFSSSVGQSYPTIF